MKLVIASAVDPDSGEQLYPRKWNHEFADMPIVHHQKQPTFTEETMSSIAKNLEVNTKRCSRCWAQPECESVKLSA